MRYLSHSTCSRRTDKDEVGEGEHSGDNNGADRIIMVIIYHCGQDASDESCNNQQDKMSAVGKKRKKKNNKVYDKGLLKMGDFKVLLWLRLV